MRKNKLDLYLHLIWATWDRQPLISPEIERPLHRIIESEALSLGCKVLALNGVPDHIHLAIKLPTTLPIADLMKQVKGVSSNFANEVLLPDKSFKWQSNYGAFTVSRWDVEKIVAYIRHQKEHHSNNEIYPEWEQTFEEMEKPT